MRCAQAALLLATTCAAACQSWVPHTVLDTDMRANYERVFGHQLPDDVDVVRSIVVDYVWLPFAITTDDWCFEAVAPRTWIDLRLEGLRLSPAGGTGELWRGGLPSWYAPEAPARYEQYVMRATSIPYVHMSVDAVPEPDGRHRVFACKR